MVNINKVSTTLHNLVLINNDRAKGYEKASDHIKLIDDELKELFDECAEESHFYANELHEKLRLLGTEDGIESTTLPGKIYRTWMDLKFAFSSADRTTILSACEFVEDAVQKAYNEALEAAEFMDGDTLRMIEVQKNSLRDSHDLIKDYRDRSAA